MTKKDQRRIVREICASMKDFLLENAHKFPEDWDGFELRQLFADVASEQYVSARLREDRKRMRAYKNERLVHSIC